MVKKKAKKETLAERVGALEVQVYTLTLVLEYLTSGVNKKATKKKGAK